jgi:hypothetical protein
MSLLTVAITIVSIGLPVISFSESLCSMDEKSLFSCKLEKSAKSVSLCQSKSDPKKISYKYGKSQKIEITLPNEKSGKPYIHYEQFGSSASQWMQSINFPSGKIVYSLSTPQGISASLSVEGIKKPLNISCESGDSGTELSNAYVLMEELKFKQK